MKLLPIGTVVLLENGEQELELRQNILNQIKITSYKKIGIKETL